MKFDFKLINWLGLATGILMILLPFAGAWWTAQVGDGAAEMALSPFDMKMSLAGETMHSDLVELFLLAAKISFIVAGIFMILSSVFPRSWWSSRLMRFGIMKPFWSVLGLIIVLVIGAFFMNNVVPGLISSMAGGDGGDVQTQLNIPYLSGSSQVQIAVTSGGNQATISAPLTIGLTGAFWLAIVTAALGIATRIYTKKFLKKH